MGYGNLVSTSASSVCDIECLFRGDNAANASAFTGVVAPPSMRFAVAARAGSARRPRARRIVACGRLAPDARRKHSRN